ncbi:MAG: phosphatidylinositol mannoside acyltransferase [Actinobacteria bacterium 69-20]|jgi:KDO2-lipid IV(A) lauroyltransferase|nr:phosphatidylinositol mannoside acyltransferase [Actinomycetota bacterium]OJV30976.1 MAG: phosphatidylinositol mannoside acyltransferase [Actinobacteria bacterium 69-20]
MTASAGGGALAALAYRAAWATVPRVPESMARSMVNRIADALVDRRGPGVLQLARNQRRVLGTDATPAALHAVVRAAMRSYGRYWLETFRLQRMDTRAVARQALVGSTGLHHIRAAQDAGRGVILALPHSGNWDIAGLSMVELVGGITTVAERLEPESVYRRFVAYREQLGFEILPLTGETGTSGRTAAVLRERLEQGRMVCLLADRDLAGNGIPVTFFGERTTMPAGPAMLAARTGAALCPVHLAYTDSGWIQYVGAPLDLPGARLADQVRGGTQAMADVFARRIALFPADWHMMQPLWTADRYGAAGAAGTTDGSADRITAEAPGGAAASTTAASP